MRREEARLGPRDFQLRRGANETRPMNGEPSERPEMQKENKKGHDISETKREESLEKEDAVSIIQVFRERL